MSRTGTGNRMARLHWHCRCIWTWGRGSCIRGRIRMHTGRIPMGMATRHQRQHKSNTKSSRSNIKLGPRNGRHRPTVDSYRGRMQQSQRKKSDTFQQQHPNGQLGDPTSIATVTRHGTSGTSTSFTTQDITCMPPNNTTHSGCAQRSCRCSITIVWKHPRMGMQNRL